MRKGVRAVLWLAAFACTVVANAQNLPGKIIRTATLPASATILDPVAPTGWTSKTTSGFLGNDVGNAKLGFKAIPTFSTEPFGDLRRGPNHLYSDFVPDAAGNGVYLYYDGTNLIFRMRMGTIIPGAKGYSILVDTDLKFGNAGANPDPNYLPATTGVNGNPGFEREIVLATGGANNGILVYNVDNNDNASALTPIATYSGWTAYSQISIAGTNDNGDPDFFLDFYVPLSDLGVTAGTPLRFNATTVMSGQAAIGGPKSDIYGLNDALYKSTNAQWEAYINAQPPVTPGALAGTGTAPTSTTACTAAPLITGVTTTGGTGGKGVVTGTWSKLATSALSSATITVYQNGTPLTGTATATSGNAWTFNVPALVTLVAGQTITATAQAGTESTCLTSNAFAVRACADWTAANLVAPLGNAAGGNDYSCFVGTSPTTTKGVGATNRNSTTWTVYVNEAVANTTQNSTANQGSTTFSNNGTTTFTPGVTPNWLYSNGCQTGSPLADGAYTFWYQDANGCKSDVTTICKGLAGTVLAPTLAPANVSAGTTLVTVTGAAGSDVSLYYNGEVIANGTIPGVFDNTTTGTITFSNLSFGANGVVSAVARRIVGGSTATSYCPAKSAARTVALCNTTAPVIAADNNGQIAAGQPITGYAAEPAGTTIRVYTSTNATTPVATVTAAADGSWTTSGVYNAVAGTLYNATAQNGSCTISGVSVNATAATATPNLCGTIGTAVNETTTAVSGALSATPGATTTVFLYQDGVLVGTTTTASNAWTVSGIAAGTFQPNSVLTIGLRQGTSQEIACPLSAKTVVCATPPAAPTFSPASPVIRPGETVTYTLSGVNAGDFYGVVDANTGNTLSAGIWPTASGTATLTTYPFGGASGTVYNIQIKSAGISATAVCYGVAAGSNVILSGFALPVTLTEFRGRRLNNANELTWTTANETDFNRYEVERSTDGSRFENIGQVSANGAGFYAFADNKPAGGANYYRLKLVNNNGSFTYSAVVLLKGDASFSIGLVQPNPFVTDVSLQLTAAKRSVVAVVLLDEKGKQVARKQTTVTEGTNLVRLSGLGGLAAGMYLLQVVADGNAVQQKLLKVH